MSRCYCACVLAVLVIVFAWVPVSWAKYVLTALGVILAARSLAGVCCCASMKEKATPEAPAAAGE